MIVNDDREDEIINEVHFVSTKFVPRGRRERMIKSMGYIWDKAMEIDADIYHMHDPELMRLVKKLKRKGKKVIFDAHEDTQEQIMDKAWIPSVIRKMVSVCFGIYQRSVLKRCDAVVTVTPKLVEKLKKYNNNVYMITNYPIIMLEKDSDSIENGDKKQYVFFAGGVSAQWCHEKIVAAVAKCDNINYRLAGPMDENYKIELENTEGWSDVEYLGRIPHDLVEKEYKGAVAGMAVNECTQIKGEGTLGNTKLFEVMAAGIPVICTDYRLWKEIIDAYNCGICVDSNNVDEIADAITYIQQHPAEAKNMGLNGRKAIVEKYNWKTQESVLYQLYDKLCQKGGQI